MRYCVEGALSDLHATGACYHVDCMTSFTSLTSIAAGQNASKIIIKYYVFSGFFYAILADDTTDIAVLEQLILYVRYLSGKGTIEGSFLGTFELSNCKAQKTTDRICLV